MNSTFDRPRQNKANLGKPGWNPGNRLCKTKPIADDAGRAGAPVKQTQFPSLCRSGDRHSREGEACQTKPIGAGMAKPAGESCETKPISRGPNRRVGAGSLGRGDGPDGMKSLSRRGGFGILRGQASGVHPRNLASGSPLGAAEWEKMPRWQNRTPVQRI